MSGSSSSDLIVHQYVTDPKPADKIETTDFHWHDPENWISRACSTFNNQTQIL